MAPDDYDAATLQAILEIQLQDLEHLSRRSKGKGREGTPPADFEVALDLLRAEMAASEVVMKDNAMAHNMAVAIWRDRDALNEAEREKRIARQDRELALQLAEVDDDSMSVKEPTDLDPDNKQDEFLDELASEYMPKPGNADHDGASTSGQPESSSWAQSRKPATPPTPIKRTECIICGETHPTTDVAHCPCSHDYCRGCLAGLFQASTVDEGLFPPRCCSQPIPLDEHRDLLPVELVGRFLAKKLEYETPNRIYCHIPDCSAFVPPQFVHADVATCVKCSSETCAICKTAAHAGECPQDEEAQAVLRLAGENRWQRCYACRRVVELRDGCYHITCICRAEFCYVCAARWKTCNCVMFTEAMLTHRGEGAAERDAGEGFNDLDAEDRARMVRDAVQLLGGNHECEVHQWVNIHGAHRCDGCGCHMPRFIFECTGCRVLACRGCRFNRL